MTLPLAGIRRGFLQAIYPPQCLRCERLVDRDFALCGACWRETAFLGGSGCTFCGLPLAGSQESLEEGGACDGPPLACDDCTRIAPPWVAGRAAMLYGKTARSLILGLKYGDRMDLARPLAGWMARVAPPLLSEDTLILPIPLHWRRLWVRRYNQAALLSAALARELKRDHLPDGLIRARATGSQEGRSLAERFAALDGAFKPHPRRAALIRGRAVLLVDDVFTSGATFSHATRACLAAGASRVSILALARVAKDA